MQINITIEAADPEQLKIQVKELYYSLCPVPKEIVVQKLPPDPKLSGSNVISFGDKLRHHIEENTSVGGHFSTTSARMNLGLKHCSMQSALRVLEKQGVIKMQQRGIWKRII